MNAEASAGRRGWLLLIFLCLAVGINAVDATVVNIALPSIGQAMHASESELQWLVDAFNITVAAFVLLGAGIADRYGRKLAFISGLAIFGMGSLATLTISTPQMLIFARVVMGVGAALVLPASLAIMTVVYQGNQRRIAVAVWAAVAGAGLALGPVIGGLLLDSFSWQSVFLLNVPVVVVAAVGVLLVARESRKPGQTPLDIAGAGLSLVALGGLIYAAIEGPGQGWTSPVIIAAISIGLVGLVAFIVRELRAQNPMFEVRVLAQPDVALSALAITFCGIAMFGVLYAVPQVVQYTTDESVLKVGLLMAPIGLMITLASPLAPRMLRKFGQRTLTAAGLFLVALGICTSAAWISDRNYVVLLVGLGIFGIGMAAVSASATTSIMDHIPARLAGAGSAVNQLTRQVGAALGVALVGSVIAGIYQSRVGDLAGYQSSTLATASRSVGEASTAGQSLPVSQAQSLIMQTSDIFAHAAQIALGVVAVMVVVLAIVIAVWPKAGKTNEDPPQERLTTGTASQGQ